MAAKRLIYEGTGAPEGLQAELTAGQHAVLASQLSAWPGARMRVWQRTHKGWLSVEIELPNSEFYKFKVDHRAKVTKARIERAPEKESKYAQRAARDPLAHREKLYELAGKRSETIKRTDLFGAVI